MAGDNTKCNVQEHTYETNSIQDSDMFDCRFTDLTHKDDYAREDDESVFYFESDHLALKGNSDYYKLVKSVAVLESQRIKIVEDIERLEELKEICKENPQEFARRLFSEHSIDIPSKLNIYEVPKINWSKYDVKPEKDAMSNESSDDNNKQNTNNKTTSGPIRVRGRVYDESKPETFNQLWTTEEQFRLEELLLEYPPERIEYNRWRKIAEALGNRTPKQVCSRVQKYFKKLHKAGISVPGHPMKTSSKKVNSKTARKNLLRTSTFFPTHQLEQILDGTSDEEDSDILDEQLKIEIITKVMEEKKKEENAAPFFHKGFKCCVCGEEPIQGTRWHCLDCGDTNLCSDCVIGQLDEEMPTHNTGHNLEPFGNPANALCDPDYLPECFATNNYLDPNFMSAE